ncbi:MAG TPA: molybdopterin cofactor-binding domain-containing protein [Vicinamibacterales bacterium]|nr:molybdopterin cofactor-binding domain-containing protein [Vicinamibacterales bacterium]
MRTREDVLRDAKIGIVEDPRKAGDAAHLPPLPAAPPSRRSFIAVSVAATGGLLVAMRTDLFAEQMQMQAPPTGPVGFPVEYIQIDPDDRVLIWSAQPEMGEGTKTSLPMLIAEELDADWTKIRIDDAPLDRKYGGQGVGGSDAIRSDWDDLRRIGATARALLISAAAAEWGVSAAECETDVHVVRHPASNRAARYGSLAARAATLTVPRDVQLKDPSRYRLIGTRVNGTDNHKIVTGQPLFGIDVRLPNMKFAAVAKCPVFNGRPVKIDATKARQISGVIDIVEIKGLDNPTFLMPGVAVVANSTWAAFKGREALVVQWDEGPYATESNATITEQFHKLIAAPPATLHNSGRVDDALASAAAVIDNTYAFPFVSHATLEPHNCSADYRADTGEMWIRGPIQMPMSAQSIVARATGIAADKVRVQCTRIGGGFGRRLMSDYAAEAAVVAKAIGGAVMIVDSREGDLQHDYYRPASMQRLRAGVDAEGKIVAWDHIIASCSRNVYRKDPRGEHSTETYGSYIGRAQTVTQLDADLQPTRIPNARLRYGNPLTGVATGAWRAPAHVVNAFAIETTIDELAARAKRSPVDLRLEILGETGDVPKSPDAQSPYDPARMRRVLLEVVERGGFGKPAPQGRARGVAMHHTFGSYCAHVVEVSVGPGNNGQKRVTIHKIVSVADVGQPVNLSMLEAQMQGGIIDGLGAAFYGEVPIANGRATSRNFGDYRLIRMREAPLAIEAHFIQSTARPTGFGEPPLPPIAPAVANAIAALTGERIRMMPFMGAGFVLG